MSKQITLSLSDTAYGCAEQVACVTGRSIAEILTATIELSLPPLLNNSDSSESIDTLSDESVLALAESHMEPSMAHRLSHLLEQQQAGTLSSDEHTALHYLMQHYHTGLLRKAQALQEAVRRGLREPMTA